MPASRIFFFARTSRCASVGSGTRNARAISGVVRPPSVRSVSATAASGASAGWQHVKISRSWSSGIGSITSSTAARTASCRACASKAASRARVGAFCANRCRRLIRSMARLRAVVVIHAPGLSGIPSIGHRSSAVTYASASASSARSKSPSTRISVASVRPWSSRKAIATASPGEGRSGLAARGSDQPNSRMGRISILPSAAPGMRDAASIASSRLGTSMT